MFAVRDPGRFNNTAKILYIRMIGDHWLWRRNMFNQIWNCSYDEPRNTNFIQLSFISALRNWLLCPSLSFIFRYGATRSFYLECAKAVHLLSQNNQRLNHGFHYAWTKIRFFMKVYLVFPWSQIYWLMYSKQ